MQGPCIEYPPPSSDSLRLNQVQREETWSSFSLLSHLGVRQVWW